MSSSRLLGLKKTAIKEIIIIINEEKKHYSINYKGVELKSLNGGGSTAAT